MKIKLVPSVKLLAALIGVSLLVTLAAKDLVPQTPMWLALTYALGGVLIFLAVIIAVMWLKFLLNQHFLNAGATDTQWLWFKSDPHGLSQIRRSSHHTVAQSETTKHGASSNI